MGLPECSSEAVGRLSRGWGLPEWAVERLEPARMPARAGLAWMQLNFEVLRKVSACVDDRHFTKMLQFPMCMRASHARGMLEACWRQAGSIT